MSKSHTLDPSTVVAFRTPGLSYEEALTIAQRDHLTVERVQNSHAAEMLIASGWSPATDKLTTERQKLEASLEAVASKEREQAHLAERWNLLLAERDDIAKRVQNTEQELQSLAEEIVGRERFINEGCIGFPQAMHGQIGRYSQLTGVVLGMKAAQAMVAELLPKLKQSHSDKLSEIGSFATQYGIKS